METYQILMVLNFAISTTFDEISDIKHRQNSVILCLMKVIPWLSKMFFDKVP